MRDYIEKDSYTGKHTVWFSPKRYRVAVYSAGELVKFGVTGAFFESFGHVNGREGFSRTRYEADSKGNLYCYDSNGSLVQIHPAGRNLRILTGN